MNNTEVINNTMNKELPQPAEQPPKKPNEDSGFYIHAMVKISDPESGEVFIEKRA